MAKTDYSKLSVKEWTGEKIIAWCEENNQTEWLKAKAAETRTFKRYPLEEYVNKKGEVKHRPDKTKEKIEVVETISFVELKMDFLEHFNLKPAPKAKPDFFNKVSKL